MVDFRVSVKGFILNEEGNLLVLKREAKDVHLPEAWEIPGGRLDLGEEPVSGLKREIKEEVGLDVDIGDILTVRHFTRQDGQIVTMLVFVCRANSKDVKLSEEHTEHKWLNINLPEKEIVPYLGYDKFFLKEVETFKSNFIKSS